MQSAVTTQKTTKDANVEKSLPSTHTNFKDQAVLFEFQNGAAKPMSELVLLVIRTPCPTKWTTHPGLNIGPVGILT